jgi:hypothetical protein
MAGGSSEITEITVARILLPHAGAGADADQTVTLPHTWGLLDLPPGQRPAHGKVAAWGSVWRSRSARLMASRLEPSPIRRGRLPPCEGSSRPQPHRGLLRQRDSARNIPFTHRGTRTFVRISPKLER